MSEPTTALPRPANVSPSPWDHLLNNFQAWAIAHPQSIWSRLLLPGLSLIEGIIANQPPYLDYKVRAHGPNFCCGGQVVLADFSTVATALTSPQARTWLLGTSVLSEAHGPGVAEGRNVFLLALSDVAAGGQDHPAFRQAVNHYFINATATARQTDPVAQQLLEQLAVDYTTMPHGYNQAFSTDNHHGLKGFFIRYFHYVLFGIQPDDAAIAPLTELHYTRNGTIHYIAGSSILETLNIAGFGRVPELTEQATQIYAQSPALKDFQENDPNFNHITRRELSQLMVSLMSIAVLQGPLHLAKTAMGCWPLPPYKHQDTRKLQITDYWDGLDLTDSAAIERFLLECARLFMPVSHSHHVAQEPFTVTLAGQERTFPPGTKILIPMVLGMLSESFWGPSVYDFNPDRDNLCPYHMGFHSVGERHAGRICPGKDMSLSLLITMLQIVGRARRAQQADSPNTASA